MQQAHPALMIYPGEMMKILSRNQQHMPGQ